MILLPVELPETRWGAEYLFPGFLLAPEKGRRLRSTQRKHSISWNCKPPRTSGQEAENVSSGQRTKAKKSGEGWQPIYHPCLFQSWQASRISALSRCYFKWPLNLNGLASNFQHYDSAKNHICDADFPRIELLWCASLSRFWETPVSFSCQWTLKITKGTGIFGGIVFSHLITKYIPAFVCVAVTIIIITIMPGCSID